MRTHPSRRVHFVLLSIQILVAVTLIVFGASASAGAAEISLLIDGRIAESDVAPRIVSERTLVPIRVISESLGWEVEWLAHTRQVLIMRDAGGEEEFLMLTVEDRLALVNGEEREMDVPPIIISGRTMVPIRFIAEAFGSEVDWDGENRRVTIASADPVDADPDGYGGSGEGPDEIHGFQFTNRGFEIQISGTFEWMLVRDAGNIMMLRLTGTSLGSDFPTAHSSELGPFDRVSFDAGRGSDGAVYVSASLPEDLAKEIMVSDSGLIVETAHLLDVNPAHDASGPGVRLETSIPVEIRTFTLKNPARAVVDLYGVELPEVFDTDDLPEGILEAVRFGRHREEAGDIFSGTRIVFDLSEYHVPVISQRQREESNEVLIGFKKSSIAGKIIAIDPGHGGRDPGAQGPTGVAEKEVNLLVSERLKAILESAGAIVVAIRTEDIYVAPYDRPEKANKAGADVFISIHSNADPRGVAEGTETYHYPNNDDSPRLAETLHHQLVNALNSNDRGVRYGNFAVLREAVMPAALIECLYLSSAREERRLVDPAVQEAVARAILAGLEQFFAN